MPCHCEGWQKNWEQLKDQQVFCAYQTAGPKYTGDRFVFCPWCGRNILSLHKRRYMDIKLLLRCIVGILSRLIFFNWGSCGRCKRTWPICEEHCTGYRESGGGCFPLCEQCWQELTPEQRLPYYHDLWISWQSCGCPDKNGVPWNEEWKQMKTAVLAGK